jgi:hypothetical protein
MKSKTTSYNFKEEYQNDWHAFIAQFNNGSEPKDEIIIFEIRKFCSVINNLIQQLYESNPTYQTQVEIFFAWKDLKRIIEENKTVYTEKALNWFVRQIMNMIICNDIKIIDSIWYAIGVDYFECGTHGTSLLPKMYEELPENQIPKLIKYTNSIPWNDKLETYKQIVLNQQQHTILATALYDSCHAYCFGSVKASEAMEILNQLSIDEKLYEQVSNILTMPVQVKVRQIVSLEKISHDGITGFLSIVDNGVVSPTWFPYAELWIENEYIGTFEKDYYKLSWASIKSDYGTNASVEQLHQEKILVTKTAFNMDWADKIGELKPT